MGVRFGTPEWAAALRDEIDASSEYRGAAAGWGVGFNGNILLVFDADDLLPDARSLLVRLQDGACLGAEFVTGPAHPDAGFVLRAPFTLWKEILERRAMAATAILTGRMRVDGDRMVLLRYLAAHRALIHCTSSLDTEFA